ncbi:MAG: hypothetical protein IIU68_07090 [Bacteroidales bacterium]|nr:hypothetical protein [Bacteroidales bacterium]MBQ2006116.1 hypothetical protein [Bacteroidales bacterium]MBQ5583093.1 hypothetical protein [Bacteroidales bacterium]
MVDNTYLNNFEETLTAGLKKICASAGLIDGELFWTPDFDTKWEEYIKEYVADAVSNFNEFPEAAIAWSAYLGLGVAHVWDEDFDKFRLWSYSRYYGARGWDDMDEHILQNILKLDLDSAEATKIKDCLLSCATATLGLIRYEGIETQTEAGFYILARAYSVLFRIGVGLELKRLGYKKVLV